MCEKIRNFATAKGTKNNIHLDGGQRYLNTHSNMKKYFFVKRGNELLHKTTHLFAAQMARECMITSGEGDETLQIVDSNNKIYPNASLSL